MNAKKIITAVLLAGLVSPTASFAASTGDFEMPDIGSMTDMKGMTELPSGGMVGGSVASPVTGKVVVDFMSEIPDELVVNEGAELTLDVNVDMSTKTIVLNNAKSLSLGVNTKVKSIRGTVETIALSTNSEVDTMNVIAKKADFEVNSSVGIIHLTTDVLETGVNAEINQGIIYVFNDYKGSVNSKFDGKLTVYRDSALGVNAEVNGRFCSLGKVKIGVNGKIAGYGLDGLLGNVDPILGYMLEDDSVGYKTVAEVSKTFDARFAKDMAKMDSLSASAASLKKKLASAKEEDKAGVQSEIDAVLAEKTTVKEGLAAATEETFVTITPFVDEHDLAKGLYAKVKAMYANAVQMEDAGLVHDLCSNSEIEGDVNAVYEKGGKIRFGTKSFARSNVIKSTQQKSLENTLDKMDDAKLTKLNSRIDAAVEAIAAKKSTSSKDLKNMNMFLDLREMLRNELLFDEKDIDAIMAQ